METYTIYAPGAWCYDIEPAMEDHGYSLEKNNGEIGESQAEVIRQFFDGERTVRKGKGIQHRFDLTSLEAVEFLHGEAEYRWEWNLDKANDRYTDPEDRAYSRRNAKAARALMDRCEKFLKEQA